MIRLLLAALLLLVPLAARAQTEQQALVDRSTLTVQEMFTREHASDALSLLRQSKGALVCPRVFKAGFIIGGSGGGCVLVARGTGGWSSPAFYTIGSGSFGLQAGVQDSEVVFLILTERGLHAVLDSQFKFGADASIAVATFGAGVEETDHRRAACRHRRIRQDARAVRRHFLTGQHHLGGQRVESDLLRQAAGSTADRPAR